MRPTNAGSGMGPTMMSGLVVVVVGVAEGAVDVASAIEVERVVIVEVTAEVGVAVRVSKADRT